MKNKALLIFPLFVICVMFAFLAVVMLNDTARKKQASANVMKQLTASAEDLSRRDITLYWAGEFPEELSPLKEKTVLLTPGKITEDIMPVATHYAGLIEYDRDGNVVNQVKQTDYTDDLLIVINFADGLTESDIEVIRQCITSNNVAIAIFGKEQIENIRKAMYKVTGQFTEHDSVFFALGDGFSYHIIDEKVAEEHSVGFYQALLDYLKAYYEHKDEVDQTSVTTTFTAPAASETETSASESDPSGEGETRESSGESSEESGESTNGN